MEPLIGARLAKRITVLVLRLLDRLVSLLLHSKGVRRREVPSASR